VPRHSLRKRVEYAFALCVVALSVAWGFAFYAAIRVSEDRVLVNQLQRASQHYPDIGTSIRGYDDIASLPEPLGEWARTAPGEGVYEFVDEEPPISDSSTSPEEVSDESRALAPQAKKRVVRRR